MSAMTRSAFKRALIWTTLVAVFLTACGSPTQSGPAATAEKDLQDEIISRGVIKIATDSGYPPFSSINAGGELEGFDVDVPARSPTRWV